MISGSLIVHVKRINGAYVARIQKTDFFSDRSRSRTEAVVSLCKALNQNLERFRASSIERWTACTWFIQYHLL